MDDQPDTKPTEARRTPGDPASDSTIRVSPPGDPSLPLTPATDERTTIMREALGQPRRIGDFELLEEIGRGGMGVVYRGRQISLGRTVAIKLMLGADADFRQRFQREARALATVDSPHVVKVHFSGVQDHQSFFVMEYVEGVDLSKKLRFGYRPTHAEALDLILQAARGLAAAGEHGIVHRDIKPGNMIVTVKGVLKLMDFGLVRVSGDEQPLTTSGTVLGTVQYFSPEQGRGDRCDHRSDLYSLGVVFYQLLTAKLPFVGDSTAAMIYQHVHVEPKPPRKVDPTIPLGYQLVVLKCLEKKPEQRYQTANELIADLERVRGGEALARPRRKRPVLVAALIAFAALATAGIAAISHDSRSTTPAPEPGPAALAGAERPIVTTVSPRPTTPAADPLAVVSTPAIAPAVVTATAPPDVDVPAAPRDPISPHAPDHAATVRAPDEPATTPRTEPVTATRAPPLEETPPFSAPAPAPAPPESVAPPLVSAPAAPADPPVPAVPLAPPVSAKPSGPPAPPVLGAVVQDAYGHFADLAVAGQTLRFRHCPPGMFAMGSPAQEANRGSDETRHQVVLSRGFWIADSECTQRLWKDVLDAKPSSFAGETLPVNKISREDAERFCARLNVLVPGLGARLPWEAEWEYASRAGSADPYPGFWKLDDTKACFGTTRPQPVKSFACNAWGMYDTIGNVREWCQDAYQPYSADAQTDPRPVGKGKGVTRGGCWEDSTKYCRSASRHEAWTNISAPTSGLRLVIDEPAVDALTPAPGR
ncbi:MAG: protein kinase [Planctomycetes bacterium]|nr:protein kinase [Planctomycetota bacterium]